MAGTRGTRRIYSLIPDSCIHPKSDFPDVSERKRIVFRAARSAVPSYITHSPSLAPISTRPPRVPDKDSLVPRLVPPPGYYFPPTLATLFTFSLAVLVSEPYSDRNSRVPGSLACKAREGFAMKLSPSQSMSVNSSNEAPRTEINQSQYYNYGCIGCIL